MIDNFTAHSANERTFLAWLRTGISVVAFGFVIEKFNLFLSALGSEAAEGTQRLHLDFSAGPFARYEGFTVMVTGIVLIGLGYLRFLRVERMIDAAEKGDRPGLGMELAITLALILLVGAYCIDILLR